MLRRLGEILGWCAYFELYTFVAGDLVAENERKAFWQNYTAPPHTAGAVNQPSL